VRVRSTVEARPVENVTISFNTIRDYGQYGIAMSGTLDTNCRIKFVTIEGNLIENRSVTKPMAGGISLGDGTDVLERAVVRGNIRGCGVNTEMLNLAKTLMFSTVPVSMVMGCP